MCVYLPSFRIPLEEKMNESRASHFKFSVRKHAVRPMMMMMVIVYSLLLSRFLQMSLKTLKICVFVCVCYLITFIVCGGVFVCESQKNRCGNHELNDTDGVCVCVHGVDAIFA